MVNNSINKEKTNNCLSPQRIEHKKYPDVCWCSTKRTWSSHRNVMVLVIIQLKNCCWTVTQLNLVTC